MNTVTRSITEGASRIGGAGRAAFATDDARWEAIVRRDRAAEGAFVYGVATTGVCCRPACASRRPNRANIAFFASFADAARAGYRACKKCRPDEPADASAARDLVVRACRMIDEMEEPPSLDRLAAAAGLSPAYFHRVFKRAVGVTPKGYAAARRVERFRAGLSRGASVTESIYDAGFRSSSRFYEAAGDALGMTPSDLRRGAAGLAIRVAVARSTLGWTLVAGTARGVCSIEFGDDPALLRGRVASRFPNARLVDDDAEFAGWIAKVLGAIEHPSRGIDLPLDIRGTAFQRLVWEALRAIPPGATATYAEVARVIGRPGAARAVARACASNPVAVAIPCHRVVRADGEAGGYRWGADRKRTLLERERAARAAGGRLRAPRPTPKRRRRG
jgi:AraC family transcriptional regulator of adaptative response/methylated-DNA-[protein]-cysteine methyltransferase